jgi:selenocysteine-specific elongation factor
VLLDREEISPGEEAYAQIVLEKPIVGYKGDPFVIRYYSPVTTSEAASSSMPMLPNRSVSGKTCWISWQQGRGQSL